MFCKRGILKNFIKLTQKHLCLRFFSKVAGWKVLLCRISVNDCFCKSQPISLYKKLNTVTRRQSCNKTRQVLNYSVPSETLLKYEQRLPEATLLRGMKVERK